MKNNKTPEIRFKRFTDDWEQRKLGDFSDKVTEKNTNLGVKETFTNSAEFGIISQRDFFDHDISNVNNIGGYYIVRSEDFVYNPRISVAAPVGPINRNKLGRNGIMSPLYTVFRIHDVNPTYLEYFFKSNYWHTYMFFNGDSGARSDRFSIKDSIFFKMPVPLPSIEEQKQVGSYFKNLDNLITLHQRKHDKLISFKKAMLEKMFPKENEKVPEIRFQGFTDDWEQRKVSEVAEITTGGTPSTGVERYWNPKEIPWLSSGEIHKKYILFTDKMISKEGYANSSTRMIRENSVLIALAGQGKTRGTVAINRIPLATNQSIAAMTFNNQMYPDFVFSNLEYRYDELRAASSGDGSRGGLNKKIVGDVVIPCPSIEEQKQIGDYFTNLNNLITLHQRKLEKLKNIKKSMLEKMFV